MKITITSTAINEKKWEKEDRAGVIRTQDAQAECASFRQRIRLDIGKSDPYPVGEYECNLEDAISVGDFGDLKLARRLPLVSIGAPAPAASAIKR